MKRLAEEYLKIWYKTTPRKPYVIRGARQVGKSTLISQFAQNNNLTLNEINLERHMELTPVFQSMNMSNIVKDLEGLVGRNIFAPNSLLFLDEIQAIPAAIQALRYFLEDYPDLPVVAAGSLLEFALSKGSFSMPVGRIKYLYLGPMTFKEYLHESDTFLLSYILNFNFKDEIPQTVHMKLIEKLKEYLYIGGMPEAIRTYIQKNNFNQALEVQNSIIETYQDDFNKYASGKRLLRLRHIFNYVPRALGRKVKYSQISKEEKSREIKEAIDLLIRAEIIKPVYHSHCNGLPLYADLEPSTYKLLFLDTGLANRVCGLDWLALSVKDNTKLINDGAIAEQFIGQHLFYLNEGKEKPRLCYWLREKRKGNAEVDYVISRGDIIVPIEVKAGKSGSLKSILQFVLNKKSKVVIRFDLNPPSIQKVHHRLQQKDKTCEVEFTLLSLPLYMVEETNRLLDIYRRKSIPMTRFS